jgi:hypothetical protein
VIPRADYVFRVDPPALVGRGSKLKSRGVLMIMLAVVFLFVGLISTAIGVAGVVWHSYQADPTDVVAAILVLVVSVAPLLIGILLLVLGIRRFRRGGVLVGLAGLAQGRSHVTVLDLAARTGKPPDVVLAELSLAASYGAAVAL